MASDAGRIPLRERNKQRILQRIIGAATELFRAVGYDQTTMDAIAEKAEVSRGTLFKYFPTKSSLLIPMAHELYKQTIQPEIVAYLQERPGTLDVFHLLFMRIQELVLTLPAIDRALRAEFYHHEHPKLLSNGTGFLDTLVIIVEYGQKRGEVRTDIPLENLAHYVTSLYVSLLFMVIEDGASARYEAELALLLKFLRSAFSQ